MPPWRVAAAACRAAVHWQSCWRRPRPPSAIKRSLLECDQENHGWPRHPWAIEYHSRHRPVDCRVSCARHPPQHFAPVAEVGLAIGTDVESGADLAFALRARLEL